MTEDKKRDANALETESPEDLQDALRLVDELLEDDENRFIINETRFAQRYLERKAHLCIHIRAKGVRAGAQEFCAMFYARDVVNGEQIVKNKNDVLVGREKKVSIFVHDEIIDSEIVHVGSAPLRHGDNRKVLGAPDTRTDQKAVLVQPVKFAYSPERRIPSLVRLQSLHEAHGSRASALYFSQTAGFKVHRVPIDWEVRRTSNSAVVNGHQSAGEVVKTGTEIVNAVSYDGAEPFKWDGSFEHEIEDVLSRRRIYLLPDGIGIASQKDAYIPYKITEVLFGPFQFGVGARQFRGVVGHVVTSDYERQPVGSAQTEDPEGPRDTRADAQAGRRRPRKDSQGQALNYPPPPEEVASQTSPADRHGANSATRTRLGSPEDA
jgi:hypothetical protein